MPLTTGTRLGPYEVIASLGAGGMGEVYRAKDTKLNRAVAIKVLTGTVAHDSERRERFEREAQTITRTSSRSTPSRMRATQRSSRWNWSRAARSPRPSHAAACRSAKC